MNDNEILKLLSDRISKIRGITDQLADLRNDLVREADELQIIWTEVRSRK